MSDTSFSSTPRNDGAEPPSNGSTTTQSGSLIKRLSTLFAPRNGAEDRHEALDRLMIATEAESDAGADNADHERILIENILELRDLTAEDVMVPRADIVAVDCKASMKELLGLMSEHGHSRLPVYRDSLDEVLGLVHVKDLMGVIARDEAFELDKVMREILFVAPSLQVLDLLTDMRKTRQQMAMVVDEFGGIDGLITVQDLVEGIVGEIEDEFDRQVQPTMRRQADGSVVADARVLLEDFEDTFGALFSDEEREDADTLGGLAFTLAGRVPARGELLPHSSGLEFEVLEADPRRIKRLRIRNLPQR